MAGQFVAGVTVCCHVSPASVEQWTGRLLAAAARLVPSAEDATETQAAVGAVVVIHEAPRLQFKGEVV